MKKNTGYFIFSMLWLAEVYLISLDWEKLANVSPLYWVLVSLATVTIAHTISFYNVGKWFRDPLTETTKDTAGGIEGVEPKPGLHPILQVVAELICCPICAGTHGATLMLLAFTINPSFGWALAAAAALSTVNMLLHWVSEKLQWEGRLAVERQGTLWLRKNYGDLRPLVSQWKGGEQEDEEDEYIQALDNYLDQIDPEALAKKLRETMNIE
jgi:hypothetical protein